ncbi:MAG: ABC transporter permease [Planctomycetaceae bacterium]|nr:ABC transporter permease [Planctomycetaceae bacterium]
MYKFLLANRYLRTRFIALASIISVTLGVATMIVVNSVMSGFSSQMKDRIHGILADVMVETTSMDGAHDPDALMREVEQIAGPYIEAMTPTVEIYGMMSFRWGGQDINRPVTLIGIVPEGKDAVSPLRHYLMSRQSIYENDELVRGPLRDMSEDLDWSLTDEAIEARESWLMFKDLREQFEQEYGSKTRPGTDQIIRDVIEENPAADPFNQVQLTAAEEPAEVPTPEGTAVDGTMRDVVADPFALPGVENSQLPSQVEQRDPSKPAAGRVYVGAGLVSFPTRDEKTGKTETIYMVQPGQDVILTTVKTGQPQPASFEATIVDVFKSGMSEYDSTLVFCNLEELQYVRGMLTGPDPTRPHENLDWKQGAITSLQIKLKNYADAPEVIKRLRGALDYKFQVRTWEQKQGPLLDAVAVESAILNVLLFLIITVAGFGILAIFYMIVVEKTRDIGIMKALGASSGGVMSIFVGYGLALGIVGSGAGVVLGLLFVHYINEIESVVSSITGRKVFDETIYYFHEIPTVVHPLMVCWVALGAMVIAVLASVLPARRASQLHPVQALRYE